LYCSICEEQKKTPVRLFQYKERVLYYLHNHFYWDNSGLDDSDVMTLIPQRERREYKKLQTARSLMRAEAAGRPTRTSIPPEIRGAVFERDGGRCVKCGSNFDLQYDHVLPVARGGATTVGNLQILCSDCNRRKGDSL